MERVIAPGRYAGMKTLLFHNPSAGDEGHSREALVTLLEASGLSVRPHDTHGEAVEAALANGAGLVLIAGGDGTVGRIATQAGHRAARLAVLPLGTANNLARALGPWPSPRHFAEGWAGAAHRHLNVAVAEGGWGRRRFVESVGFGAFARAVEYADKTGEEGVEPGRAVFRRVLSSAPAARVRISVDGREEEVETLFVEVMNIALFGPNLALAQQADPGDGLLDVVTLPPGRRAAMLDWLRAPGGGAPPVDLRRGAHVVIGWPGGPVRVDDEPLDWDAPTTATFGIEPEPLTFLVPPACLAAPQKAPAA